jgi:predicted nucleic acid-binding protein
MLAYHEENDCEVARRVRCSAASRGPAAWDDGVGADARSDRGSPRRRREGSAATPGRRRRAERPVERLGADRGDPPGRGGLIALIVDAGPLYAYVDRDDRQHEVCLELLETHPGPLIVPVLVITEVVYLLGTRLGVDPEIRFLGDLAAGNLLAEPVMASDWIRIAELTGAYRDLPLGAVDASVVATAERLGERQVATLDRRDFSVVRPRHLDGFELLP